MIRLFLLAALLIAPVAAERSLAPGIAPEPFTAERLAADVNRIAGGNLTLEEWVVVLALGHGYNVTRDGIVTLDDGERIDISALYIVVSGPIEISLEHAPHENDESPPQSSAPCARSRG
jgi:hypothetical protein